MESMFRATTICGVKRNGRVAIAGDGQVTYNKSVAFKSHAHKVKRIYNDKVLVGFAGGAADAFALCEKFENMLNKFSGNLLRSAVELASVWRNDSARQLEALMIVADKDNLLMISGVGDVIEPDDGVCAIGSGENFALGAAKALMRNTKLSAREIAQKSVEVAGELCIYTNTNIIVEEV